MNEKEYINRLKAALQDQDPHEAAEAVLFVQELFDEALQENQPVDEVILRLGVPEVYASRILAGLDRFEKESREGTRKEDSLSSAPAQKPSSKRAGKKGWAKGLFWFLTSPFWIVAAACGLCVVATLFCLFVALGLMIGAMALTAVAGGAGVLLKMFMLLGKDWPGVLFDLGLVFCAAGLSRLFWILFQTIWKEWFPAMAAGLYQSVRSGLNWLKGGITG